MSCLLYCVTQPNKSVTVAMGICDSLVQSQEWAELRVYWSELQDPEACLGAPESLKKAALQFQQVLREILAETTPIPFYFPTLLENVAGLEQQLATEQELYRAALIRVGDAVQ